MKIKSMAFSLSSLFTGRGSSKSKKENLIQPTGGYIRVAKEWMTVEEYRRRYLCERRENVTPEKCS